MSKKAALPQSRRHVMIYDEDWEFLELQFGPQGHSPIGVSNAIKTILHDRVVRLKALANQAFDKIKDEMAEGTNGK